MYLEVAGPPGWTEDDTGRLLSWEGKETHIRSGYIVARSIAFSTELNSSLGSACGRTHVGKRGAQWGPVWISITDTHRSRALHWRQTHRWKREGVRICEWGTHLITRLHCQPRSIVRLPIQRLLCALFLSLAARPSFLLATSLAPHVSLYPPSQPPTATPTTDSFSFKSYTPLSTSFLSLSCHWLFFSPRESFSPFFWGLRILSSPLAQPQMHKCLRDGAWLHTLFFSTL